MKKIVISGYYGFHNTGDEAILHSIITNLRELGRRRGEELSFTVLSADPEATAGQLGVNAIPRTSPLRILRALLRSDVFISGGGGLLQDTTGRGLSIVYYLGLVVLARLFLKPVIFYAQGFGPVRRFHNRLLVRLIANRVQIITVRDRGSLDDLAALGVKRPFLAVTVDPVFMLEPAAEAPRLPALPEDRPLLGIAARPWPGREQFLAQIAGAVNCLVTELNAAVVLVPMHHQDDLPVCRELASLLKNPPLVLEQPLSPPETAALFGSFDLVVAMRLHALIFAARAGVPMLGIGYDRKVDAFLARVGQKPAGRPDELEAADLACQAMELWSARQQVSAALRERSEEFKTTALLTAEDVLDFILNPRGPRLPRLQGRSGEGGS
jgi:polysaccharide pyruvyl transferase CsaB